MQSALDLFNAAWQLLERAGRVAALPLAIGLIIGGSGIFIWDTHRVLLANQEANEARQETRSAQTETQTEKTEMETAQRHASDLQQRLNEKITEITSLQKAREKDISDLKESYDRKIAGLTADNSAQQVKLEKFQKAEADAAAERARVAQKRSSPPPTRPDPVEEITTYLNTHGIPSNVALSFLNGNYSMRAELTDAKDACRIITTDTTVPEGEEGAVQDVTVQLGRTADIYFNAKAVSILYQAGQCYSSHCNAEHEGHCYVRAKIKG
jgi:hypothetical protein